VIVAGGGAAGFFAAIACAEAMPGAEVIILERSSEFLGKVRISGGGRCNVTHACFDPRELATRFPRGEDSLIGPFHRFQPRQTVAWFVARGVELKVEDDGRMFPTTDSSETIINCLLSSARRTGVQLRPNCGLDQAQARDGGGFLLALSNGEQISCDRLLLATGGCRAASLGQLATSLGHTLVPPVPSLFTFQIACPWLRQLAGVTIETAEVSVPAARLRERGPLLVTHWGLSGPAVLRLSAWGARALHGLSYQFPLRVNWLPGCDETTLLGELNSRRSSLAARLVINAPIPPLPARLWEQLVVDAGIERTTRWSALSRAAQHKLIERLMRSEFSVVGKSLNKDEFVTCGGVKLSEVNFKTMESRICPGLYFAGELLDIDGITGGFNFQSAWTTGWIAGNAIAESLGPGLDMRSSHG